MGDGEGKFILFYFSIYAPSGRDVSVFLKITNIMVMETERLLICGGDLNFHLQPELDNSSKRHLEKNSLHKKINALFEDAGL